MNRIGTAHWEGDLQQGKGRLSLGSGAYSGPYSFGTRFGETPGTNPEELIGAAHAACFSMALAADLSAAGFVPTSVDTTATVKLERVDGRFSITGIDLKCQVNAANISPDRLMETASGTKRNCPVSRALDAVPITLSVNGVVTGR